MSLLDGGTAVILVTNGGIVIAGFFTGGALAVRGGFKAARNSAIGCAVLLAVIEGVGIGFQRMMAENTKLEVRMLPPPFKWMRLTATDTLCSYRRHPRLHQKVVSECLRLRSQSFLVHRARNLDSHFALLAKRQGYVLFKIRVAIVRQGCIAGRLAYCKISVVAIERMR